MPLHKAVDQGQSQAAACGVPFGAGGPAVFEDRLGGARIDAGAVVGHPDEDQLVAFGQCQPDPASLSGGWCLGRRVDGVVEQVADDGQQAPQVWWVVPESGVVGETDANPTFGGDGGLGDDEPDHLRVADVPAHGFGEGLPGAGRIDGVLVCGLVFADVQQPGDRVHPVGELVLLGPQGVGQSAYGVEFTQQADQLGAVAYGDHGAQFTAVQGDRHVVDD